MKAGAVIALGLLLAGIPVRAQQTGAEAGGQKTGTSMQAEGPAAKQPLEVTGPLVSPFRGKASEVPGRLLNLINPFAPVEPSATSAPPRTVRGPSPRAWTTVAGWHPGRSAFPDAVTHESGMALISISRRPEH